MYKLVDVAWEGKDGAVRFGSAVVEYTECIEEGHVIQDITDVFLPEFVPPDWTEGCKEQAQLDFHLEGG